MIASYSETISSTIRSKLLLVQSAATPEAVAENAELRPKPFLPSPMHH